MNVVATPDQSNSPSSQSMPYPSVKIDPSDPGGSLEDLNSDSFSGDSQMDEMELKEESGQDLRWHRYESRLPEEQKVERAKGLTERRIWSCPVPGCGRSYWYENLSFGPPGWTSYNTPRRGVHSLRYTGFL